MRAQCGALHVQQADFCFTRRELREAVHWGDTQLKVHLVRLVEMEFLAVHRRGLTHAYELVYDGRHGDGEGQRAHLCGLREVEGLSDMQHYDSDRSGSEASRSASGRGVVGARSATGRGASNPAQTQTPRGLQADAAGLNGHEDRQALFRHEQASMVLPSAA